MPKGSKPKGNMDSGGCMCTSWTVVMFATAGVTLAASIATSGVPGRTGGTANGAPAPGGLAARAGRPWQAIARPKRTATTKEPAIFRVMTKPPRAEANYLPVLQSVKLASPARLPPETVRQCSAVPPAKVAKVDAVSTRMWHKALDARPQERKLAAPARHRAGAPRHRAAAQARRPVARAFAR